MPGRLGWRRAGAPAGATGLSRIFETVLDLLLQPQRGAFRKEDGESVIDAQGRRVPPPQP